MLSNWHPGFILIIGSLLSLVIPKSLFRLRKFLMLGIPFLALISVFNLTLGTDASFVFINNLSLHYLKVDQLSWVFSLIFALIALLASVYALHNHNKGENVASLLYAGSSLSVVLAGDWLTLIFFWEMMAVSSVFLIWYKKTPESWGAGFRYILIHMLGGNLLLAGICLKIYYGQPLVNVLTGTNDLAFWLILAGVAINAAIPPLHAWLVDAYPEGTVTGSVFLSSFTTKVAVYSLIRIFPGTRFLLVLGVIMAIYGVIYAIIENDMRRLLSYHIISQVGFMVAAVGLGTELSLNGATAHAFSHILYKSLLFMSAGAIIYATGKRKLSDLGGLYKTMPIVCILFFIGAFSISGVPLFNGYISKSIVLDSTLEAGIPWAYMLLSLASVGTFLSITLKMGYFIFFGEDKKNETIEIPKNMYIAMSTGAFLCTFYGLFPDFLYTKLPFILEFNPFTLEHFISTAQMQVAIAVVFFLMLPKLKTKPSLSLDTDWLYRKPFKIFFFAVVDLVSNIRDSFGVLGYSLQAKFLPFFKNPIKYVPRTVEGPAPKEYDEDTYRFPIGLTVFMIMFIFVVTASFLLFF